MKKILIILICFLVQFPIHAWTYPNNQSGYPYANSPEDQIDQWSTFTRNCTSYVMWKINNAGKSFNNNVTGPNGNSVTMGNASTWDEHANYIGYTVDKNPAVGDPVNWEANSGGAGSAGHVAWVEQVHSNNTIFLSEWNWNYGDGLYNERDGFSGDHYIHIVGSSGGACDNISNRTIGVGQTLNCQGTIKVLPETFFKNGSTVILKSS